jgi:transposase
VLRTFRRSAARARNQVACRLHAVLCGLVPGGASKEITAAHATRILEQVPPPGAVARARCELAAEFPADLRRLDTQLRESKKKLAVVVRASGTTFTGIFGVGPVIAATVIGDVGDVSRFPSRDRFAAYNGTAPVEVSSGDRKIYRLSRRGNRRLNHAIHMAAVTQIRQRHSDGRAYYDKKIAEGKTHKEALRYLGPATTGNSWSPTARSSSARCCLSTRPAARFNRRLRSAARAAGWPPAWGPPVRPRWRGGLACRRC